MKEEKKSAATQSFLSELGHAKMEFKPIHEVKGLSHALADLPKVALSEERRRSIPLQGIAPYDAVDLGKEPPAMSRAARNTFNDPIDVETGYTYTATMPSDNNLWLRLDTSNNFDKKVSIVTKFEAAASYWTSIYKLDYATMTLNRIYIGYNVFPDSDAAGFIEDGSYYYIWIERESGSTKLDISIEMVDNHTLEPDDSFFQARVLPKHFAAGGEIEGYYDWDWYQFTPEVGGEYFLSLVLRKNENAVVPIMVCIYDSTTGTISLVNTDTPIYGSSFKLKPGVKYGLLVKPSGDVYPANMIGLSYYFNLGMRPVDIGPAGISVDTLAIKDIKPRQECIFLHDWVNVPGDYWRVDGAVEGDQMIVSGEIDSIRQNCMAPIIMEIRGRTKAYRCMALPVHGKFSLIAGIPPSAGADGQWYNSNTNLYHYYDWDHINFYDYTGYPISDAGSFFMNVQL